MVSQSKFSAVSSTPENITTNTGPKMSGVFSALKSDSQDLHPNFTERRDVSYAIHARTTIKRAVSTANTFGGVGASVGPSQNRITQNLAKVVP